MGHSRRTRHISRSIMSTQPRVQIDDEEGGASVPIGVATKGHRRIMALSVLMEREFARLSHRAKRHRNGRKGQTPTHFLPSSMF